MRMAGQSKEGCFGAARPYKEESWGGAYAAKEMKAGSATCQEAGRFPSVPPPQSLSGKLASTLQQPMADGVPSSTFNGLVYNGPKPGSAAMREECMDRHSGMHSSTGGVLHRSCKGTCPTKEPGTAWK